MADNHTHITDVGGIGLATILIGLIFLFVWPGPLRYDYTYRGQGLMRIDRLNGRASMLKGGKYVPVVAISKDSITFGESK